MTLAELLRGAGAIGDVPAVEARGLDYDSRHIEPGWVFFAFPGAVTDGHRFIEAARKAGAVAVVSERPQPADDPGPWVRVRHGRRALALASLAFYNHPDRRLKLTAVTGTNGKTTVVYLIDSILRAAGKVTGRFGTIGHRVGEAVVESVNTTPESVDMVRLLKQVEAVGGECATLEASSHALELGRIYGLEFHTAVYTNLSQDHLDFHPDMDAYARAKQRLFEGPPPPRHGVLNFDDPYGREWTQLPGFAPLTYGRTQGVDVRAVKVRTTLAGIRFDARTPRGDVEIRSKLRGDFNVANLLAALAAGLTHDLDLAVIQQGLEACSAVPGRFEAVDEGQPFLALVDYAHTPDALENVISAARRLAGKGRVITLFGCGGDRDRAKRPLMGEAAGRLSDRVILTSDNPRTEDPLRILADAEVGLQRADANYVRESDRAAAIRRALSEALPGDVVLIAGKGHETYQQIGREKLPFDDREAARDVLRGLTHGRSVGRPLG